MSRIEYPRIDWRISFLTVYAVALLLLLTRTWQLAFLAGFVGGMLSPRGRRAFAIGSLGVAIAWLASLIYVFVSYPAEPLAALFVSILGLNGTLWWILPMLTLFLGVLVGGVGGLAGYTGSHLFLWAEETAVAEPPKG